MTRLETDSREANLMRTIPASKGLKHITGHKRTQVSAHKRSSPKTGEKHWMTTIYMAAAGYHTLGRQTLMTLSMKICNRDYS